MSEQSKDNSVPPVELGGSIWFRSGRKNWGNQKRMDLLGAIDQEGSITAAAKKVGLSYKAAWDAVDTMNNLAGEPLVLRTTGGRRGGGAVLTERAQELIQVYCLLHAEHERFMARLAAVNEQASHNLELIQHMMVDTSARNKLMGVIRQITPGAVNDEITLELNGDTHIVASITNESVQSLGLKPGKRALAFIKASSVLIGIPAGNLQLSARNQLRGTINRIVEGAVNSEVCIELLTGHVIASVITKESQLSMGLKTGQDAYAIFKASSVMLGVLD